MLYKDLQPYKILPTHVLKSPDHNHLWFLQYDAGSPRKIIFTNEAPFRNK